MTDTERMDWLSQAGRWVLRPEEESVMSYHTEHKEVAHYIDGRYTRTFGKTLREAIDAAISSHSGSSGSA